VGLKGFATSKNIKEGIIRFRVESSWISNNALLGSDIILLKWDGSTWVNLETMQTGHDSEFTYFDAKTSAFSPFAILGSKERTELPVP